VDTESPYSDPRRAAATNSEAEAQEGLNYRGDRNAAPYLDPSPLVADRQAEYLTAARRNLAEAYTNFTAAGLDSDSMDIELAIVLDRIAAGGEGGEGGELDRSDPAGAHYERYQARHRRPSPDRVISDVPGVNMFPDPRAVRTPAEFMEALRHYRIWAGKPSFRVMQRQCGSRFVASSFCMALRSDKMPSLDLVQAVIIACSGLEEHQRAFTSAWRQVMLPRQDPGPPTEQPRVRVLYPVK
jgi:hypothetical protein